MRILALLTLAFISLFALAALGGCGGGTDQAVPPSADEEGTGTGAPAAAVGEDVPAAPAEEEPVRMTAGQPAQIRAPSPQVNAEGKIVWRPDVWKTPPRGLPFVTSPWTNPMSVKKVELGRLLYFDKRLSKDGTVSCASCHHPATGFSNAQRFAAGVNGQLGDRNSPTIYNVAYQGMTFWDGRALTLEEQALGPVQNPIEMGNTLPAMVASVAAAPEYKELFKKAFDGEGEIDASKIAQAIASFERSILSGDAPYVRFKAGDSSALSAAAQRGLAVFEGKGQCLLCHSGPFLTDQTFHNLGVGTKAKKVDPGRMNVTKDEKDWGKFKTPTVRNIAVTGPFMHDGSETTLEGVVELYDRGGVPNKNLDPFIRPLGMTPEEKADLVTFMKEGLTREIEIPIPPSAEAASN